MDFHRQARPSVGLTYVINPANGGIDRAISRLIDSYVGCDKFALIWKDKVSIGNRVICW